MRIDVLTLFPEMFGSVLGTSILKRAAEPISSPSDPGRVRPPVVNYHLTDIRDYTTNKHKKVDQPSFGGGPGMVMQCQPVWDAVQAVEAADEQAATRILMTPQGRPLTQSLVEMLAGQSRLMMIAGHYEGIDQRVLEKLRCDDERQINSPTASEADLPAHEAAINPNAIPPPNGDGDTHGASAAPLPGLLEISVGDYVLSGGELPAMILIDAVVRLLPGALGHHASAHRDSFSPGTDRRLDHPHYTRPRVWREMPVPDILLSGDHARIDHWRRQQAYERTRERRPDLLGPETDRELLPQE